MTSTNYPGGVTNAPYDSVLGHLPVSDPTALHLWFNDFDSFIASEWTVTETQAGATQAIANGDGGILALVNSAASADLNAIQLANETFAFTAGKQAWFKARFSLSSATNAAAVVGLQITDTTPLSVSDGLYFSKASGATALTLVAAKSGATTSLSVTAMADATYVEVGFYYDGNQTISAYLNGNQIGSMASTNLTTHTLAISAAVSNGTAAANTLNVDYILAATER